MKPIDQLTEEELRVECAEAIRWRKEAFGPLIQDYRWHKPDGQPTHAEPPNYPADANSALTLAAALAEHGWRWTAFDDSEGLTVRFARWRHDYEEYRGTATSHYAFALALCRAYLAVVRSESNS